MPLANCVTTAQLRSLGLTKRQSDILTLALRGDTAVEIAAELSLSRRTVETHFEAIYGRFGVTNRAQAIMAALVRTASAAG